MGAEGVVVSGELVVFEGDLDSLTSLPLAVSLRESLRAPLPRKVACDAGTGAAAAEAEGKLLPSEAQVNQHGARIYRGSRCASTTL